MEAKRLENIRALCVSDANGRRHQRPGVGADLPGGPPEAVYRLVLEGRVELVTSRPLLAELGRILARLTRIVQPGEHLTLTEVDPADNRVLVAAAEGAVDPGDSHLLDLGT